MRYGGKHTKARRVFILCALLLFGIAANAQRGTKHKDKKIAVPEAPKDSVATPKIEVYTNCKQGIYGILLSQPDADTLPLPNFYSISKIPENFVGADTNVQYKKIETTIENNASSGAPLLYFPPSSGKYVAKAVLFKNSKNVYSGWSDTVTIMFCSKLEFPDFFNREIEKTYRPPSLINIQIVAFDIFDRKGNPVYTHKNNDINWDGNYPDKQICPTGVYYYHCEYIDLAADGEKKSLSGMIELKN